MDFGQDSSIFADYLKLYNEKPRANKFRTSKRRNNESKENSVDIRHQLVFLMDATASMSPYIKATKDHIQSMIAVMQATSEEVLCDLGEEHKTKYNLIFEIACVCYRDFCDDCMFETIDFTTDIEEFKRYLSIILAKGGGDEPEDVIGSFIHSLYGLENAPCLSWDARGEVAKRMLVWIADAPPHGEEFFLSQYDNYPESMLPYWKTIFETLSMKNISLSLVRVNRHCDRAHSTFKNLGAGIGVEIEIIDISQTFRESGGGRPSSGRVDGEDGVPLPIGADGRLCEPDCRPVPYGADGKPLGPGTSRPLPVGADGRVIGEDGKPLPVGADGRLLGPDMDMEALPYGADGRPLGPGKDQWKDGKPLPMKEVGEVIEEDEKPLPVGELYSSPFSSSSSSSSSSSLSSSTSSASSSGPASAYGQIAHSLADRFSASTADYLKKIAEAKKK